MGRYSRMVTQRGGQSLLQDRRIVHVCSMMSGLFSEDGTMRIRRERRCLWAETYMGVAAEGCTPEANLTYQGHRCSWARRNPCF